MATVRVNNIYSYLMFQCGVCGKLFVDETYLQSHQARRHAGQRLIETVNHTSFLKEEIKQLKDRLHSAESKLYIEVSNTLIS